VLIYISSEHKLRRKDICSDLSEQILKKLQLWLKKVTGDVSWTLQSQPKNKMPKSPMGKSRVSWKKKVHIKKPC
jgi:hypothetical protein